MKKLLCLLLALVCMLACVSCNKDKDDGEDGASANVETIAQIIDNSNPTQIVTKVDYIPVGESSISSSYVTERDEANGIYAFSFKYSRKAMVGELLPDDIKVVEGTVWYNADGTVTSTSGDTWSKEDAVGYLPEMINIGETSFKSYEFLNGGEDLKGVVEAKDGKRVFGSDIGAASDIEVEIDTNGNYLYNVKITYFFSSGAQVQITTSYDYSAINLKTNK